MIGTCRHLVRRATRKGRATGGGGSGVGAATTTDHGGERVFHTPLHLLVNRINQRHRGFSFQSGVRAPETKGKRRCGYFSRSLNDAFRSPPTPPLAPSTPSFLCSVTTSSLRHPRILRSFSSRRRYCCYSRDGGRTCLFFRSRFLFIPAPALRLQTFYYICGFSQSSLTPNTFLFSS